MQYRILSFDPGLSFSGWALSTVTTGSPVFRIEEYGMLTPNKTVGHKEFRDSVNTFGSRIITLTILRDLIRELVTSRRPDFVASEDTFFNPRRPSAYEALLHWILTVTFVLKDDFSMPLIKVPPKLVKKYISNDGTSTKEGVQAAIFHHKDIQFNEIYQEPIELTEHEGDAIAIGYSCWNILKENHTLGE